MFFCIDMKSFFASVECSLRGLNPSSTPLVVVDEERGNGAIVLAVTPYLKKIGISNRCRLYEIDSDIKYIKAKPRMKKYIEYAAKIYRIFLKYVDDEDIHTYSIDESFIDITNYLKYNSPKKLALMILNDIEEELGIKATCGSGDNMFLAKVSLDLYAKKAVDCYDYLSYEKFIKVTWYHKPLTDIWQIGRGINRRLNILGIYDLAGIARMNVDILKKEFGINGVDLYEHAWGKDSITIKDIKSYNPKNHSLTRNQILFRNYTKEEAWIPLCEMLYLLCMDLVRLDLVTSKIIFSLKFSNEGSFSKQVHLYRKSNDYFYFKKNLKEIYEKNHFEDEIRVIYLSISDVYKTKEVVPTLFDYEEDRYKNLSREIIKIWKKYGKNKLVIGTAITTESTLYERNKCIGGHNSE